MLKLFVKALGFMAALVLSSAACAVGMGSINVTTALGEPLKAEIELSDISKGDRNNLAVRMASPEAFKDAGLDYPANLPTLKFQIEKRADGEPYIELSSEQPVNEPFVNMLVELSWPSGKLWRQYTFLLDPPGFRPVQPKAAEVQPLAPAVATEQPKPAPVKTEALPPMRATSPVDKKALATPPAPKPAATAKPLVSKPAAGNVVSGPIKVKRGDTLSKLARETRPPEVSLERMLVAMYRANEDEFDGHNMNRLRTGKILRLPEQNELNKVTQVEAVQEIRAQVADWNAYRQKLAAASSAAPEQAPRQEASGKISTTVADKTPPAKESARDVVRLSKGEAPGDKAAAGRSMQDKLQALQEEAIAKDKALKESEKRIAMLEKNIKEMQHLLELKGQPVPAAKPVEVKPLPTEPAKQAATAPVQPAPAKPVPKPAPKPVHKKVLPPPPPPSLMDEILGEPLYLAGGAAALLILGGAGLMLARRRRGGKGGAPAGDEAEASSTAHITAPIAPSPDTGDFTQISAGHRGPEEAEDVDPVSEAELFLNFGRDAQAEEILKDALKKHPDNQQVRLKLLSIYADRKDVKTFSVIAQQVQDSGDAAAWELAAEMGRKLDPGNPMYGGEEGAAVTEEEPQEESTITQSSANLDFDLGLGAPETEAAAAELDVPVDEAEITSSGLDFDLGAAEPEEVSTPAEEESAVPATEEEKAEELDTSVMDFDLGLEAPAEVEEIAEPAAEEEVKPEEAPLDFDITGTMMTEQPEEPAAEAAMPEAEDLVFDVTATHLVPEEVTEEPPQAEAPVETAPAEEMPREEETAEKPAEEDMAITLDFEPAEEAATEEPVEQPKGAAMDLGEISLDVATPPAAPREPASEEDANKDARWHDVATKLDLARAYQEMGDAAGAKEILDEVMSEGDAQQRATAQAMMKQL